MGIVWFDSPANGVEIDRAVVEHGNGLGLNASENRCSPGFVLVGVSLIANDVLVTPAAVSQQCAEIALRAAWREHRRLFAEQLSYVRFESIDGWVVTKDVVADLRVGNGLSHAKRWPGHSVGAQVNHAGEASR